MTTRIPFKVVAAPAAGVILKAPPVLKASEHSVDFTCGRWVPSAACRRGPSSRHPDPLHKLRIIQFNGWISRLSWRPSHPGVTSDRA
jgi:hypothetical protein